MRPNPPSCSTRFANTGAGKLGSSSLSEIYSRPSLLVLVQPAPSSALCGAPHKAELGAAWGKTSEGGRDYLSVKLDDPSFTAPIYANLIEAEDGTFNLLWSRSQPR